ncbi:hypothetical protein Celaphus_00010609 [Cervus elaphus hippelaphus]|uniref:Uncharacterized protein n=1 Tax=Cervus elaphus hippelaphus TaxID=46360 RepID=A0A212CA58_CEREH|nr:hypothetical protein Celaphus_00010609 [Cervus elaphus hippelaphus]
MASPGVLQSGSGSLGLLVWLLALQPWLSEALVGGEGAQGRSALPSLSPPNSGGSRKDPGARRWKLPPAGAPGTSGAAESRMTSVAPSLVAFTLSASDSYKDVTPPQAPGVTKKPVFPSDTSPDSPEQLQEAELSILRYEACNEKLKEKMESHLNMVKEGTVCGTSTSGKDACQVSS